MKSCPECGETIVFEYDQNVMGFDVITFTCGSRYYIKQPECIFIAFQGDNCKLKVIRDLKVRVAELEKQIKTLT